MITDEEELRLIIEELEDENERLNQVINGLIDVLVLYKIDRHKKEVTSDVD